MDTDELVTSALQSQSIAVVGCSSTPGKDAHEVPKYLAANGYDVIPVNPYAEEIFGRQAYDTVADVPDEIDLVDVFRPSEEVPGIVDDVVERDDVDGLWLQHGVRHDAAADRAREAGIGVVQDRCLKVEHARRR